MFVDTHMFSFITKTAKAIKIQFLDYLLRKIMYAKYRLYKSNSSWLDCNGNIFVRKQKFSLNVSYIFLWVISERTLTRWSRLTSAPIIFLAKFEHFVRTLQKKITDFHCANLAPHLTLIVYLEEANWNEYVWTKLTSLFYQKFWVQLAK